MCACSAKVRGRQGLWARTRLPACHQPSERSGQPGPRVNASDRGGALVAGKAVPRAATNTTVGAGGLKQQDALSPRPVLGPPGASLLGL